MQARVLGVSPYMHGFQGWPAWRTARQGLFTPKNCATPSSHYTTCGVRPAPTLPGPGFASTLVPFYSRMPYLSSSPFWQAPALTRKAPCRQRPPPGVPRHRARAASWPELQPGLRPFPSCSSSGAQRQGKRTKSSCRLSQLAGIVARISSTPTLQQPRRLAWSRI